MNDRYYHNSLIHGKTRQNKNNAALISRNYLYLNIVEFLMQDYLYIKGESNF